MFSCRLHSLENLSLLFFFWLKIETQFVKWKRHESIFSHSAIFTHSSVSCLLSPRCRCRESFSPPSWVARSRSTSSSCNFPRFYFVNKEFFIASCRCDEGKFCPGKSMTLRLQPTFCVSSESHDKENVRALPDMSRKRWKWNIYQLTKITFANSSSESTRDPTNEWVTFSLRQQNHHHHRHRITTHISTLPVNFFFPRSVSLPFRTFKNLTLKYGEGQWIWLSRRRRRRYVWPGRALRNKNSFRSLLLLSHFVPTS